MPNYRFEFLVSEAPSVVVELATLDEAKAEAFRSLAEALWERSADHHEPAPRATKIYDDAGRLLATVTLQYCIQAGDEETSAEASEVTLPDAPAPARGSG